MYAYITGKVAEKSPTCVVLDNQGIGYCINITLNTFTAIGEKEEVRLYVHEQILEDAHNDDDVLGEVQPRHRAFGQRSRINDPALARDNAADSVAYLEPLLN